MISSADNSIEKFLNCIVDRIEPHNKYCQFLYPWYTNDTKIWYIGLETNGWGDNNDTLQKMSVEELKKITFNFISDEQYIRKYRKTSFWKYYFELINNDLKMQKYVGWWNFYPIGLPRIGYIGHDASKLLFECNWKDVFWEIIKGTNPDLVIFAGAYIRNKHFAENLIDKDVVIIKGDIINFKETRIINIDHPQYRFKNKMIAKKCEDEARKILDL
jgi:hypothetical protein